MKPVGVRTITALAIPILVLLAGCTGATTPNPLPTDTSASSPSPTTEVPEPVATTLSVSATGLTVLDENSLVMVDIPFVTAADVAAAQLTDVLGAAPSVTEQTESNCLRGGTLYSFEGFTLDATGTITIQPAAFSILVTAPTTTGGVALVGPAGTHVGQPVSEVLAAIPDAAGYGFLVLQNTGTADNPTGVGGDIFDDAGYATDNVTRILSPVVLAPDC